MVFTRRSPHDIKKEVQDQLGWDSRVNSSVIKVEVRKHTVTLDGSVPSLRARSQAVEDAYRVTGVSAVDNRLSVKFPASMEVSSDTDLESKVRNSLLWNSSVDASRIKAVVESGKVTLTGPVTSYYQKIQAGEIAQAVSGVREVDNRLDVVLPVPGVDDDAVRQNVQQALKRNISVDAEGIAVAVVSGNVTLKGTVGSRSAYLMAEEIAFYTSGVRTVNNDLRIE